MDLYTTPPPSTYILGLTKWFVMPTEDGKTIPAVAVTQDQGQYWNSGFTLVITFMFTAAGQILADWIITYFPLGGNGNRHAILVAFYNTGDPISATLLMGNYTWKLLWTIQMKGTNKKIDWGTFYLTFGLFIYMLGSFTASTVAGILIPNNLLMGNVARVNPAAIFYPVVTATSNTAREASARLASDAAFRALGTVEYSREVLIERVTFNDSQTTRSDGNIDFTFGYSYEITGYDFGLQRAPGLTQLVSGICETHYEWYQANLSNATMEVYYLWGNASNRRDVSLMTYAPPRALFEVPSTNGQDVAIGSTIRYSVLPNVAGSRTRFLNRTDPWYFSEPVPLDTVTNTTYAYAPGRPALACNQSLSWQYGSLTVPNTRGLDTLIDGGLKLATFWRHTVFAREFQVTPAIVSLGRNLGFSNLASVTQGFSPFTRVENSDVSLRDDMEELILGSFVYSREVVRNTALLSPNKAGLQNVALNGSTVPDGTADFVIESKDIQTLSLRVLISIPAILVLLWIWILIREKLMEWRLNPARNDERSSDFVARAIGFSAVQMYRYLDEEMSGQRRWEGRLSSAPYIKEVDPAENKKDSDSEITPLKEHIEHIPVSAQYTTPATGGGELSRLISVIRPTSDPEVLQAKYATPKMMLVYEKTEPNPGAIPTADQDTKGASEKEIGSRSAINPSPTNSQSTSGSTQVPQPIQVAGYGVLTPRHLRYELAMTRTWRQTVEKVKEPPQWDEMETVQNNSEVNPGPLIDIGTQTAQTEPEEGKDESKMETFPVGSSHQ